MNEEQEKSARIVLHYLEENNSHTIGRLLYWDLFDGSEDGISYRTWLVAKNYEQDEIQKAQREWEDE